MFKCIGRQVMSFVDDDERAAVFGVEQVKESQANAGYHFGTAEERLVGEGSEQFAIEARDADSRIGEIDNQELIGVEGRDETAQSGGFSRTDLAGEQANAALAGQEGEAAGKFLQGRGREKVVGRDVFGEGQADEAIMVLVHVIPPQARVQRMDWQRGAGGQNEAARLPCVVFPGIPDAGQPNSQ